MKVLVACFGSYGDVHPFLALGKALEAEGAKVLLFTNPHFQSLVESQGLEFRPVGTAEDYRALTQDPDLFHPHRSLPLILRGVQDQLPETYRALKAELVPGATIAIGSSLAFAVRLLEEAEGVPAAMVHLAPSLFFSAHRFPRLAGSRLPDWLPVAVKRSFWWAVDRFVVGPRLEPDFQNFRKELGLEPAERVFGRWMHSPRLTLGLFPEWFGPRQPDWPASLEITGFPLFDQAAPEGLPGPVLEFLEAGDPPIVFAPGSAQRHGGDFFRHSLEALSRTGLRGIFVTPYREQLPKSLPPSVAHFDYVPFSQLLTRAQVLVHHGGIGTTSQALATGVPQLVRPLAHDQFDNAERIQELGLGIWLGVARYHGEALDRALIQLSQDADLRTRAKTYRDKVAADPGPTQTARLIVDRLGPCLATGFGTPLPPGS